MYAIASFFCTQKVLTSFIWESIIKKILDFWGYYFGHF